MTSPADVIQNLLKIGVAVHDAYVDAQANGGIDWKTFLDSTDFKNIQKSVTGLLDSLDDKSIDGAIDGIDQKRTALLAGRDVNVLSSDELIQYFALLHARSLLVNKWVDNRTDWSEFLNWLSQEALPTLVTVAKTVIPLLL